MGWSNSVKPGVIVLCFGILGLITAGIEKVLNDNGYLIDEYVRNTVTLPDIQIVTIIFALICGVIVAILWGT